MSEMNGAWKPSEEIDPNDLIKMTENGDVILGSGLQKEDVIGLTGGLGGDDD